MLPPGVVPRMAGSQVERKAQGGTTSWGQERGLQPPESLYSDKVGLPLERLECGPGKNFLVIWRRGKADHEDAGLTARGLRGKGGSPGSVFRGSGK